MKILGIAPVAGLASTRYRNCPSIVSTSIVAHGGRQDISAASQLRRVRRLGLRIAIGGRTKAGGGSRRLSTSCAAYSWCSCQLSFLSDQVSNKRSGGRRAREPSRLSRLCRARHDPPVLRESARGPDGAFCGGGLSRAASPKMNFIHDVSLPISISAPYSIRPCVLRPRPIGWSKPRPPPPGPVGQAPCFISKNSAIAWARFLTSSFSKRLRR